MKFFLNFGRASATFSRAVLPIAGAALLAGSCQSAPEHISYTNISATLNDSITLDGNVFYAKQFYRYPQLRSMANAAAQDSLNRLFKLADFDALQADAHYISVQRSDSISNLDNEYLYSFDWLQVSYLNDELISYSGMTEYSGGAHPSYELRKARTLALNTLQPIPLEEMFVGDYKSFFKAQSASSGRLAGFKSNDSIEYDELGSACGDILDALLLHIDTMTASDNMLVGDTALSILQADFRDFGCPEVMRNVIEVRIPYSTLAPYINPNGPLRHFLSR
ncbi:MAG: DUF4163 domain-containing protein [Prevotellaceae bacterium]|jgi:hypothetical protein|nr:DUF4163 domain-containing protein [Prevotellaceae bacterium]